jgi:arachidonate 15-lipoxygenase
MKPLLPQHDRHGAVRQSAIARNQALYQYDHNYLAPFALLDGGDRQKKIPKTEQFSLIYKLSRGFTRQWASVNQKVAEFRIQFDPFDQVEDYDDLYNLLPAPYRVIQRYQADDIFAQQRLCGANPMAISRLMPSDDRAKILKELPRNIQNDLANGNIYITDYTGLAPGDRGPSLVKGGRLGGQQKYLPKCRGFFRWNGKTLEPLVIQLSPSDTKLYSPADKPLDWLFAKTCLQIADGNHQELNVHLARVHLVMEPFSIATQRQLAANHPLSLLLRPHFRFLLANNNIAHEKLINPQGPVEQIMAGTLEESLEVVKQAMATWRLDEAALPDELAQRGMDDTEHLPFYPYRDDALLLWQAIYDYVSEYLNYFYSDNQAIQGDAELQAWAEEVTDGDRGRIKGMPSQIESVTQLINIVTNLLFISGPQHAAVNFSQYDYMTFAANMPLAAYCPPISQEIHRTAEDILDLLPPYSATAMQLRVLYLLSAYRYDRLGDYKKSFHDLYGGSVETVFAQTPVPEIIQRFQARLVEIETTIDHANRHRTLPYPFLKPSLIPNSTSV